MKNLWAMPLAVLAVLAYVTVVFWRLWVFVLLCLVAWHFVAKYW